MTMISQSRPSARQSPRPAVLGRLRACGGERVEAGAAAAAENQAQRQCEQCLRAVSAQQPDDPHRSDDGDDAEQPALHPARIAEEAERRAGVMRQHQIEYADDVKTFAIGKVAGDPQLAGLVEHDDQRTQGEPFL